MPGTKGMAWSTKAMPDKELWALCEKQYAAFCNHRYDITTGGMPEFRKGQFFKRAYSGGWFELSKEN